MLSKNKPSELNTKIFNNNLGIYVQLIPFYNCSIGCEYCFTYSKLNSSIKLSPDEFKDILIKLDTDTKNFKIISLSILGGELTESKDYYKYLDNIFEVFSYRKESVKIEFLSNLTGSIKQYEYFYKKFQDFNEFWSLFTIHNNAVRNNKSLDNFAIKLQYLKENNYIFNIDFLQSLDKNYSKINKNNENYLVSLIPEIQFDIIHSDLVENISESIYGTNFNKHKISPKKVFCHANYICIRPEGITNECNNTSITFDIFFKKGLKSILKSKVCTLNECPCFPDLRNIVGFINLKK